MTGQDGPYFFLLLGTRFSTSGFLQCKTDSILEYQKGLSFSISLIEETHKQEVVFHNQNMAVFLTKITINALKSIEK